MDKKYWVPAIEKMDAVVVCIAKQPGKLKLIDISRECSVNKSSLFSILHTLEELGWIYKENNQTYTLGRKLGLISAQYTQQFDLTSLFNQEAEKTSTLIGETIQLSILEEREIIYIAKKEGSSVVRIVSGPGMRMPAHATAMGKVMLSQFTDDDLEKMYEKVEFEKLTNNTVDNLIDLQKQISDFTETGYIVETQESVKGFVCIAAPVRNEKKEIVAAVSFTMTQDDWNSKNELCKKEIINLSESLSQNHLI